MWERDHERYFVVRDNRYLDTIECQWEERNEQKEMEKIQRVSKIESVTAKAIAPQSYQQNLTRKYSRRNVIPCA